MLFKKITINYSSSTSGFCNWFLTISDLFDREMNFTNQFKPFSKSKPHPQRLYYYEIYYFLIFHSKKHLIVDQLQPRIDRYECGVHGSYCTEGRYRNIYVQGSSPLTHKEGGLPFTFEGLVDIALFCFRTLNAMCTVVTRFRDSISNYLKG